MQLVVGEIFEGKVTGITKFGAFVAMPDGRNGLVHISEIANTFVNDINDYVKEGQMVKVKVIEVDEKTGKISLDRLDKPEAPEGSFQPKREGGRDRKDRGDQGERRERRPRRREHRD